MKTLLLIISLAFTGTVQTSKEPNVYVCMSEGSVAYHKSKGCKGLNKCTHKIKEISVESAVKLGRRKCKVCY